MSDNLDLIQSGAEVTFTTNNPLDTTTWVGTIIGVDVSYVVARQYGDLQSFHTGVKQTDSSIDEDYTKLSYFLLGVSDSTQSRTRIYAFSKQWITNGTFRVTSNYTEVTLICALPPGITTINVMNILKSHNITVSEKK